MLNLGGRMEARRALVTHHRASCWRITRKDGNVYRFTNHDTPLKVMTAPTLDYALDAFETFSPAGGFDASARQRKSQLEVPNVEIRGAVSSSVITEADLRAGRWDDAQVDELLVDARYPWAGVFVQRSYVTTAIVQTGEVWTAELDGAARRLRRPVGRRYERDCVWEVGDANCGVVFGTMFADAITVTAVDASAPRRKCTLGHDIGHGNLMTAGFYALGKAEWKSGDNDGLVSAIREHDGIVLNVSFNLELELELPFDIKVGDTVDLTPGCNKKAGVFDTTGHCANRYSNIVNHSGFIYIPGNDGLLQTP